MNPKRFSLSASQLLLFRAMDLLGQFESWVGKLTTWNREDRRLSHYTTERPKMASLAFLQHELASQSLAQKPGMEMFRQWGVISGLLRHPALLIFPDGIKSPMSSSSINGA
jgi:hypothetical protein